MKKFIKRDLNDSYAIQKAIKGKLGIFLKCTNLG